MAAAGPTAATLWRATDSAVRRHFGAFATLAAAFAFLPGAAMRILAPGLMRLPTLGAATPAPIDGGVWLGMLALALIQLVGLFTIAAVTADSHEGGGRSLGAVMAAALPGLARFVAALLLFTLAYLVAALVVGLVVGLLAAIVLVAGSGGHATPADPANQSAVLGITMVVIAVVFPIAIWLSARLWPLVGVYLREPIGIIPGIRRAWSLSRERVRPLLAVYLALLLASLTLAMLQLGIAGAVGETGLAATLAALVEGALGAIVFVYFAALTGVVYRQLAA